MFMDKLMEEILNAPVRIGLVAQGHIPTIEKMLAKNKSWAEIGAAIHWEPNTAKEWYQAYLEHNANIR
jgi:hypothetical protein